MVDPDLSNSLPQESKLSNMAMRALTPHNKVGQNVLGQHVKHTKDII